MGQKVQILKGVSVRGWSFGIIRMISGFCHKVHENCALLGCYATSGGNFFSTFRDNLLVPSNWFKNRKFCGYRGMVQLFNAVKTHQQNLDSQVKEKKNKLMKPVDKRAFLDILMGRSHSESVGSPVKLETEIKVRRVDT
jgi:hypothetical protein